MIKDNYILIQGWMIEELDLRGNELLAYALIHGFCQDGQSEFSGSTGYVATWLNISKRSAIKVLQNLTEKGLIVKNPIEVNRVVFNRYKTVRKFTGGEESSLGVVKKVHQGGEESSPNNIDNNIVNKLEIYIPVLDYLNKVLGTKYKATSDKTRKLIDARIKEGFSLDDFKKVIDNKVKDWKGTDMEKYLRPETLFGTKFEGYLNTVVSKPKPKNTFNDFDQREYDYDALCKKLGGF